MLLVTHDRWFLDKVVTSILDVEAGGRVTRYEGNWEMYRRLHTQAPAKAAAAAAAEPARVPGVSPTAAAKKTRLTYKDQRELDGMEAAIEQAEAKKAEVEKQLRAEGSNPTALMRLSAELDRATAEVERLYARWQQLQSSVEQ